MIEAKMINGEAVDIPTLCTLASTTVRLSQRLGLERRAKLIERTPSPEEYSRQLRWEEAQAEEARAAAAVKVEGAAP
jgi:hypothetical protein